jgi:DNA-directed RNA polymerase subunit RPC12/RpoP
MQAKLPDVNAAIVRHRTLALEGFKSNASEQCIVSLESINALLPILEDGTSYKVEVNTAKYKQLSQETREIKCHKCNTENLVKKVEQYDLTLDWLEQILSDQPAQRMWICTACGKSSRFNSDDITVTKKGNPYFFKVMPSPPARTNGIRGRMTFDKDFQEWFSIAMPEIESQIGIYRSEYAKQEDDLEEIQIED